MAEPTEDNPNPAVTGRTQPSQEDYESARGEAYGFLALLAIVALIVSPFLLGFSFGTVETGEVAIKWNQNTNDIYDDKLYEEGRYFTGLGVKFVKFPKYALNLMEDETIARTQDGLTVALSSSFHYKLKLDATSLVGLYKKFGHNYANTYKSIAAASLRDTVSTYLAYNLVSARDELAADLQTVLNTLLAAHEAEVIGFQILSIAWSPTIDNVIMEAVVALEDVETAHAEVNISAIAADTLVAEASISSEEIVISANATASVELASKTAEAEVIRIKGVAQAAAFGSVKTSLVGMTEAQLMKYVYLENILGGSGFKGKKISVDTPASLQIGLDEF